MTMKKVAVLMGSPSDRETMAAAEEALAECGVPYETFVLSAHRTPQETATFARKAEESGFAVIIAGAGAAAHLAGSVAAQTILPVIGVPLDTSPLKGLDALLSTVQMPAGVPVATMAIGAAGARNAGILAAQMLALQDATLRQRLRDLRRAMAEKVLRGQAPGTP
ncbi:MAG: 5-(carboxyamino)imidazole ribonucleotide mutase [Candidatus Tectomicrobia bacterium]|nr:5-(carboxyamino)imidazole ribonucleotide mutase [Candidatus Tectomicrobia bacterium]